MGPPSTEYSKEILSDLGVLSLYSSLLPGGVSYELYSFGLPALSASPPPFGERAGLYKGCPSLSHGLIPGHCQPF